MLAYVFIFCGLLILSTYFIKKPTLDQFIIADRNIGAIEGATSIAITWVWAPALFISAKVAYDWGYVGLLYFVVPNVLTLVLFGYFAAKIRILYPNGVSLSQYMNIKYSGRVGHLYKIELVLMSCAAIAVQLVAGGQVLSQLTDLSYTQSVILIFLVPTIYSLRGGLKVSIFTDKIQYILILIVLAFIIPLIWGSPKEFYGIGGNHQTFGGDSLEVLKSFGIPASLGLLAGAFGSPEYWQRGYALKGPYIKSTFLMSAALFGIVPIIIGFIGFAAVGINLVTDNSFLINIQFLQAYPVLLSMFVIVLLCGLMSTIDSAIAAIPSVLLNIQKFMLFSIISIALLIAFIPGIQVLHLFIVYGMIRASVFLPTVFSILFDKTYFKESTVFYGIVTSLIIGIPLTAYSQLNGLSAISTIVAIFVTFFPGVLMMFNRSKS